MDVPLWKGVCTVIGDFFPAILREYVTSLPLVQSDNSFNSDTTLLLQSLFEELVTISKILTDRNLFFS